MHKIYSKLINFLIKLRRKSDKYTCMYKTDAFRVNSETYCLIKTKKHLLEMQPDN